VVPQIFHVLQEKGFALVRAQLAKCPLDLLSPHRLFCRMLLRSIQQRAFVVDECLSSTHTPCPTGATTVDETPEQPCAEALRLLDHGIRAMGVHIAEGPATEGRKAYPEDRAHVAIP